MTDISTIIHLLRDSDRPASHARLMDDAAMVISIFEKRMEKACAELREMIDGGEESRGRDAWISNIIRILEGDL